MSVNFYLERFCTEDDCSEDSFYLSDKIAIDPSKKML